jgi:hypothetical protein
MTATTSIHPDNAHRPLWAALAFAGAAVLGITATIVVLDDGSSADRTGSVAKETSVANPSAVSVSADAAEGRAISEVSTRSAVPVSADAAEARGLTEHVVVRLTPAETGSADAAERGAMAEQARDLRACSYSAALPDAVERCLNGG